LFLQISSQTFFVLDYFSIAMVIYSERECNFFLWRKSPNRA
jgi:hypothetical protein